MFRFLLKKFSDVNLLSLIFLEIEGWIYWLLGSFPGAVGIVLRNIAYMFFFKKKKGIVWVQPRVTIIQSNRLVVGRNCAVNTGSYINAKGGICFGDNVLVGANVTLSSGKHPIEGSNPPIFERPTEPLPIIVEDDVWIGANAVIMPGVTLKKGTVVGAGAIVTKNTEEYSVVVGIPARILKYRIKKGKDKNENLS